LFSSVISEFLNRLKNTREESDSVVAEKRVQKYPEQHGSGLEKLIYAHQSGRRSFPEWMCFPNTRSKNESGLIATT